MLSCIHQNSLYCTGVTLVIWSVFFHAEKIDEQVHYVMPKLNNVFVYETLPTFMGIGNFRLAFCSMTTPPQNIHKISTLWCA